MSPPDNGAPARQPNKSRMCVVDTLYHQAPNESPTGADSRFYRWLDQDEQPYGPRVVKVGPDWAPLDCGWLDEASMVLLECRQGAELEIGTSAVVDSPVPFAVVRRGESARFEPYNLSCLRVRSTDGEAKYAVTIIPE